MVFFLYFQDLLMVIKVWTQFARCYLYKLHITVDWNRITNGSSSFSDRVKDKLRIQTKSTGEKFMDFAKKNVYSKH